MSINIKPHEGGALCNDLLLYDSYLIVLINIVPGKLNWARDF